jgi:hypothetical protein
VALLDFSATTFKLFQAIISLFGASFHSYTLHNTQIVPFTPYTLCQNSLNSNHSVKVYSDLFVYAFQFV